MLERGALLYSLRPQTNLLLIAWHQTSAAHDRQYTSFVVRRSPPPRLRTPLEYDNSL